MGGLAVYTLNLEAIIVQNSHKIKIIYSHTGVKHFYTRKRGARPFPEHADDWFDLQISLFLLFASWGAQMISSIIPPL